MHRIAAWARAHRVLAVVLSVVVAWLVIGTVNAAAHPQGNIVAAQSTPSPAAALPAQSSAPPVPSSAPAATSAAPATSAAASSAPPAAPVTVQTTAVVTAPAYVPPAPVHTTQAPPPAPAPVHTTQAPQPVHTTVQAQHCYPLTSGGNCYEPGEYCRNSDHGASGIDGDGDPIKCEYNNSWRWERV